jgi:hypothetical protein
MSATIPTRTAADPSREEMVATDPVAVAIRDAAVASLKRKRKFARDAVGFIAVNGVLWLVWLLADRSMDGSIPWPAWITAIWGFLLAIDAWRAFGSWPASLNRPITEADIEREMKRTHGN